MVTTTKDASAPSMTMMLLLLGCSVIIIVTESFNPSSMPPMVGGGRSLSRTGPATAYQAASSSDADLNPNVITNISTAAAALRHAQQTPCELRSHSRSRASPLGISNSSPFRPGASLRSSSELSFRTGTDEPGPLPVYLTESETLASAVGHNNYYPHYSSSRKGYDEEGYNYESLDQEEGGRGVLSSSSSVLMSSLSSDGVTRQRSRGPQGYEFRRVEVRASWKECQGKWLRRSAAPIVDLVGLAAPLILIMSLTMGTGNFP